jgi:hypothetical protein
MPAFQEEHEKIVETRVDPDSDITWEEYKSMRFTSHVCTQYAIIIVKTNKQKITSFCYLVPNNMLSTSHAGYT